MLDPDSPDQASSSPTEAQPRRRRTASRPAGPPPEAESPTAEASVTAAGSTEATTERPKRTRTKAEPGSNQAAGTAAKTSGAPKAPAKRKKSVAASQEGAAVATAEVADPAADAASGGEDQPVAAPARRTSRRKASADAAASASDQSGDRETPEPITPTTEADLEATLTAIAQRPRRRRGRAGGTASDEIGAQGETAQALEELAAEISAGDARGADWLSDDESELAEVLAEDEAAETDNLDDDDLEPMDDLMDDVEAAGEGGAVRRRRRRRGGRRRRRGSEDRSIAEDVGEGDLVEVEAIDDLVEEIGEEGVEEAATGVASRRRRRRRRRGEDVGGAVDDEATEVVVRVREPHRARVVADEITGIEGSTRMEAKRQRRREGRAAGRRRAPILSEAEFLARRESVDRRMVIRQSEDYTQIGVLEDGILVEHYVDRASATSLIGNVYLGRVQNVLPSMEAAFVDIGRGRNAVIYAGEVDWDSFGEAGQQRKVEQVFKSGQAILVQVTKDPVGAKGARLTSHISIPGRYVVYSPGGQLAGISRKLPEPERKRLKEILDQAVGSDATVIVRTAAEGASEEELVRDVNRLKAQWEVIEKKVKGGQAPQLLYAEPDLTVRIVRDLFTEDFGALIVDGNGHGSDAYDTVEAYVSHVAPHLRDRLVQWDRADQGDLFEHYRVNEQLAKALERKVYLPSGGSLVIDRTEAMTVIDVNTGRFTGSSGNLESTVTSNNLEAAEEIVRQLRLRDIGGIIVIDFIDMVLPSNRELLLRRLIECLGRDRTRHQVAEVTSLGLVQMTRKKIGTGLAEAFTVVCETCQGRGYHRHDTPVETQAHADGGDRDHHRRPSRQRGGQSEG